MDSIDIPANALEPKDITPPIEPAFVGEPSATATTAATTANIKPMAKPPKEGFDKLRLAFYEKALDMELPF